MCVLSGSDYNNDNQNTISCGGRQRKQTIFDYYKLLNNKNKGSNDYFYHKNENIDYNEILRLCDLFDVNKIENTLIFGNNNKDKFKVDRDQNNNFKLLPDKMSMKNILSNDGFIFLN